MIDRLRRTKEMREARINHELWWYNPNNHPEPTLPSEKDLREVYLARVALSKNTSVLTEATELVDYAFRGKER